MTSSPNCVRRLPVCLGAVLLAGCLNLKPTSDPTRHFVLSAVCKPPAGQPVSDRAVSLGLSPVNLPAYAKSPWIAIRTGKNEIQYSDFYRWGEPIEKGVQRVLALNLSALLETDRIGINAWRRDSVDYELAVTLTRFDLEQGGAVRVEAQWQISASRANAPLSVRQCQIEESTATGTEDPAQIVAAMSQALGEVSQEIAESVKELAR